jgi:hypothetical protein
VMNAENVMLEENIAVNINALMNIANPKDL